MTHSPRRIRLHPSYPAACYHIVNAERRREAPTNKKEDTALVEPIRSIRRAAALDSAEWIYELKSDRPRLISRNHNCMTRFEKLARQIAEELEQLGLGSILRSVIP